MVAAFVKACNFTKERLCHGFFFFCKRSKIFGTFFDALQQFSKSSQKYWRKIFC